MEDNRIDDPFTLASPTSSVRYNVTARRRWDSGLSLSGSYRNTDVENDESSWVADTEQAAIGSRINGRAYRFRRAIPASTSRAASSKRSPRARAITLFARSAHVVSGMRGKPLE